MSVEISVYTEQLPLTGLDIIALATKLELEMRFFISVRCCKVDDESLAKPFRTADLLIYCWPAADRDTTRRLDRAISQGDKAGVLTVEDRIGWFEFRCEKYDYVRYWKRFPDERKEFEESISSDALKAMRAAKTRYFFRCGLRPRRNAVYLDTISRLVRDATNGVLAE